MCTGTLLTEQSDIARLRSLVIHSLYTQKEVFLRELLSNANDALEKLRITSLTEPDVMASGEGNVTIKVDLDEGGKTGTLTIRDTGIGMTKSELSKNLGTIARSGTSEFLKLAEESKGSEGNLIGQFGLGFYSAFLVSPEVKVSSLPPPTKENPHPVQHTFVSTATGDTFEVYPDPRGNTLGRGTEIVLTIGEEDKKFLSTKYLKSLVDKHSLFSTPFPIYLWERQRAKNAVGEEAEKPEFLWIQVNDKEPIWTRDPKTVSDKDYIDFFKAINDDKTVNPLGWSHFSGDTASGISYKALMYIPNSLPKDWWTQVRNGANNVRLMVKRVFITDDLGPQFMPRWLSFVKITVDADDLPLNVSRENLQNTRFLSQLQRILVRKALDLFTKIAEEEPEKFKTVTKLYGNALRIGMIESEKGKHKIAKLLRFQSTKGDDVSFEQYVANRKEGQKQIYYMAGVGEKIEDLKKSPFVEKLIARGYEVLLLNQPADEPMMEALSSFAGMKAQDVAKKGLEYGDEELDKAEKAELAEAKEEFEPLTDWLKEHFKGQIAEVVITNRLVTSPCTIVVDSMGWSANMQRVMQQKAEAEGDPMFEMLKNLPKTMEINPKAPLIRGLLARVQDSPDDPELLETARVLVDTTLVRSGFDVPDTVSFFERVESLLRRSIAVDAAAKTPEQVKPAPPQAAEVLVDEAESVEEDLEDIGQDDEELEWEEFKKQYFHDEL